MPKFGFKQPILGGGEEVEVQIQELGGGRGGFTTHASPIICIGFIVISIFSTLQ